MISLTDLPGIHPDASSVRDIIIGLIYAIIALPLLGILIAFLPIIGALAVGTNWRGSATRFEKLPGISASGGLVPGLVAGVYGLLVLGVVMSLPGGEDTDTGDDSVPDASTVTETPVATQTAAANTQQSSSQVQQTDEATATSMLTATPTPTPTATATPPPTPSEEDRVRQASKDGLSTADAWSSGVRSIKTQSIANGKMRADIRYNLDTSAPFSSFTAKKAERRAGFTARSVILELLKNENVDEIAIYAYVPTTGGNTVSTKIVISREQAESVNWDACAWECLRQKADQYKFNGYLY